MEKTYDPQTIEIHWLKFWQQHELATPQGAGEPYCIMLPPPNVTGTLHMGHGFQHTLMDALIRRQRMLGKKTLWQPGTDHAGIATQMVVERQLARQGLTRQQLGRDGFIRKVQEWRDQSGTTITAQIRRMGSSLDWQRERYSMDIPMTRATYAAFIRLYEQGLIYRGQRLVNWDPKLLTAISDLEVVTETQQGHLWYLRYPLASGQGHIVVATTRPETLFGDTAVAVHPDDERYCHLIGQMLKLPLTDREIPIIADASVNRIFGTGCVKITPAHDFNDYEIGKRHELSMINVLTPEATLNENAPPGFQQLDRYIAREKVIADLQQQGLIEKIEDYQINVPKGDRSGAVIEPLLTNQWYINMAPMAAPALDLIKQNKLRFIPENWTKTYCQWLENIQDWCISRQLWWGHQIPVWYDQGHNAYAGFDEQDVRSRHHLGDDKSLTQDEDVLDTWFTASLYPFATLGWPEITPELQQFYPSNVLVTGFDIIFFWVARMVMMGLHLVGDVPFREVYVTGLIRDSQGQKMSKTKGNILDPLDLIHGIDLDSLIKKRTRDLIHPDLAVTIAKKTTEEFPQGIAAFGTDALRFTFCALANTGRDINFDMGRIAGYRNFCNKLWNAARYVLMNIKHNPVMELNSNNIADRWIQSQLQRTIVEVNQYFEQYRFDLIAQALHEFTWNEYCDWYLELVKCTLNNSEISDYERQATEYTLISTLETVLRLIHPLIPFISEEIWQTVSALFATKQPISIMLAPYPEFNSQKLDENAQSAIDWLKDIVSAIRNIRSEIGISPAKKIPVLLSQGDAEDRRYSEFFRNYLTTLARVSDISWCDDTTTIPANATAIVKQLSIHIPLAGLIDKQVELTRLTKEIAKLQKEKQQCAQKLNNPNYLAKAPAEVVAKEQQRLEQTDRALTKLQEEYAQIERV